MAKDDLDIHLLFSNKHKDDIIIKKDIDELAAAHPNFKVHYTLSREHKLIDLKYGRIDWKKLESLEFPMPADDVFYIACGTPDFNKSMAAMLAENGFEQGKHYM